MTKPNITKCAARDLKKGDIIVDGDGRRLFEIETANYADPLKLFAGPDGTKAAMQLRYVGIDQDVFVYPAQQIDVMRQSPA